MKGVHRQFIALHLEVTLKEFEEQIVLFSSWVDWRDLIGLVPSDLQEQKPAAEMMSLIRSRHRFATGDQQSSTDSNVVLHRRTI
jgi:hypothetical protein